MQIEISYHSMSSSDALDAHVRDTINNRLERFSDRLTRVEVHLGDENGKKPGPHDKRCMLEARPAGKDPIAVEEHADDIYKAITEAAKDMVRALEKRLHK